MKKFFTTVCCLLMVLIVNAQQNKARLEYTNKTIPDEYIVLVNHSDVFIPLVEIKISEASGLYDYKITKTDVAPRTKTKLRNAELIGDVMSNWKSKLKEKTFDVVVDITLPEGFVYESAQNKDDYLYIYVGKPSGQFSGGSNIYVEAPVQKVEQPKNEPKAEEPVAQTSNNNYYRENTVSRTKSHKSAQEQYLDRGYRGFAEAGYCQIVSDEGYNGFYFGTTHGGQIIPNLFVGAGMAFQERIYNDKTTDLSFEYNLLPIYFDIRTDLPATQISSFVDFKVGYSFGIITQTNNVTVEKFGGLYICPSVGVRLSHFAFVFGYEIQKLNYSYKTQSVNIFGYRTNNYTLYETTLKQNSLMFSIQWDWGARF